MFSASWTAVHAAKFNIKKILFKELKSNFLGLINGDRVEPAPKVQNWLKIKDDFLWHLYIVEFRVPHPICRGWERCRRHSTWGWSCWRACTPGTSTCPLSSPVSVRNITKYIQFIISYCRGHNCIIPDDDFSPYMYAYMYSSPTWYILPVNFPFEIYCTCFLTDRTLHTWYFHNTTNIMSGVASTKPSYTPRSSSL